MNRLFQFFRDVPVIVDAIFFHGVRQVLQRGGGNVAGMDIGEH